MYKDISLVPRFFQFFNDACRKTRELGKIHHLCDVRWKGLGVVCAYASGFHCEKHDWKTAELSKLESPGTDMLTRARNVSKCVTFRVLGV